MVEAAQRRAQCGEQLLAPVGEEARPRVDLLLAMPRPIDDFAGVTIAIGKMRQEGVDRGVGLHIDVKLAEPTKVDFGAVVTANGATARVATDELERARSSAHFAAAEAAEAAVELARREKFLAQVALAAAVAVAVATPLHSTPQKESKTC